MAQKSEVLPATSNGEVLLYDHGMFPTLLDPDPIEVQKRFARQFQKASSIDDLFDVLDGNNSQKMVGKRLHFKGVQWAPYEADNGIIPLAIVDAMDADTGDDAEFATTGGMMVLFLRQAEIIDAYPFNARIVEKTTRSGRKALNLERIER